MKFVLLLPTLLALSEARVSNCKRTLPFLEVCAFSGCFLNIAQRDMEYLNCDRALRGKLPLQFIAEGKCSELLIPKCHEFDFK
ncbi:hypothetical protein ACLKA7_012359 [Drosophila subpalustris]